MFPTRARARAERQQRDSRMCTRPAHAHTCVAASGAHSLASSSSSLPPGGVGVHYYVLGGWVGVGRITTAPRPTRGGSIARKREGSFSPGGSHTVPLSWVMPDAALSLCLCSCVPCWLPSFVAFPLGLVCCYKPSMRCRPHASHAHCVCAVACPALPVDGFLILLLFPTLSLY